MNKHNDKAMLEIVLRLSLHFHRSWDDNAQLAALALDWAEDLADYPLPVVQRAAKLCRTESGRKYFPSTGEMVAFCDCALGEWRRQQNRLALPEEIPMSEQQKQRQLNRLKDFRAKFSQVVCEKMVEMQ